MIFSNYPLYIITTMNVLKNDIPIDNLWALHLFLTLAATL